MFSIYTCAPIYIPLEHYEDKIVHYLQALTLAAFDGLQLSFHSTIF